MASFQQLSQTSTLTTSDQVILYSTINGSGRRASLASLLAWIEDEFKSPNLDRFTASPNVNGTTVPLPTTANSLFVLLTPTGPFAATTLQLPPAASLADGQLVVVYTTQAIGALTVLLNGAASVNGAPSALLANSSFTLRYDATSNGWYAVARVSGGEMTTGTFTATLQGSIGAPGTLLTTTGTYSITGKTLTFSIAMENVDTTGYSGNASFTTTLPASLRPVTRSVAALAVGNFTAPHNAAFADLLVSGQISFMQVKNNAAIEPIVHNAGAGRLVIITGSYIIA